MFGSTICWRSCVLFSLINWHQKIGHLRHPSPNENDEARARRCVGSLTLQTSTLKCGRGGGMRNFGLLGDLKIFRARGCKQTHQSRKKTKKISWHLPKKRMQTLFEGRNPSSNSLAFSGGKLLFCGSLNQVRKLKLR